MCRVNNPLCFVRMTLLKVYAKSLHAECFATSKVKKEKKKEKGGICTTAALALTKRKGNKQRNRKKLTMYKKNSRLNEAPTT